MNTETNTEELNNELNEIHKENIHEKERKYPDAPEPPKSRTVW